MQKIPRQVIDLSGAGWTFNGAAVSVPHTWNGDDAADGPNGMKKIRSGDSADAESYLRQRGIYARKLPDPIAGRRHFLKFAGASIRAEVSVNGRRVGEHVGAFTAFGFEITDFLTPHDNRLEVVVDNRYDESTQPMSADFSVFGGLYRGVELIITAPVCIDPITDGANGVTLYPDAKSGRVRAVISVLGGANEMQEFVVPEFQLWSPETPVIYTQRFEIASGDAVTETFGFRTAEFREDGFYLNGVKRQLRGVNIHQDRAGLGWALSTEAIDEDIRIIREMGADALRTAHYPHSRHTYDLCDEQGLICWVEYPNVNRLTFTESFEMGMLRQLKEMVAQHRNHPSIAMWSVFNELYNKNTWMMQHRPEVAAMIKKAIATVRRADPTRAVVAATDRNVEEVNDQPDALGLNVYPCWYYDGDMREVLDERFAWAKRPILGVSEYGVGGSIRQHASPTNRPKASGAFHPEEYQAYQMHDNLKTLQADPRIWGHFVWAMFDFAADARTEGDSHGINDKGLVTRDRRVKKDAYYLYRANWTIDPVLHLVGSRATQTSDAVLDIMAFDNLGPAELLVNGVSLGSREPDAAKALYWHKVALQPGANLIELRTFDRYTRWLLTCKKTVVFGSKRKF